MQFQPSDVLAAWWLTQVRPYLQSLPCSNFLLATWQPWTPMSRDKDKVLRMMIPLDWQDM